jgi:hypothetical protein
MSAAFCDPIPLHTITTVLKLCPVIKMVGIDATWNVTFVQDKVLRLAMMQKVGKPMRRVLLARIAWTYRKISIAIGIATALPQPTFIPSTLLDE